MTSIIEYSQTSLNRTRFLRTLAKRTDVSGNEYVYTTVLIYIYLVWPNRASWNLNFHEESFIFYCNFPRLSEPMRIRSVSAAVSLTFQSLKVHWLGHRSLRYNVARMFRCTATPSSMYAPYLFPYPILYTWKSRISDTSLIGILFLEPITFD